jgi:hypothetical protein
VAKEPSALNWKFRNPFAEAPVSATFEEFTIEAGEPALRLRLKLKSTSDVEATMRELMAATPTALPAKDVVFVGVKTVCASATAVRPSTQRAALRAES